MGHSILTFIYCVSVFTVYAEVIPGELNAKCLTIADCRNFGYLCARNRTCQCLRQQYIPNKNGDKCVGFIDQKCKYDEHCIEGAFCLNQSKCRCKENFRPDEDGQLCSKSNAIKSGGELVLLWIILHFLKRYL